MEQLVKRFYASYDPSRVYDFLSSRFKEERLVGAGSHFKAYKLHVNGMDMAIKLSAHHVAEKSDLDLIKLQNRLLRLKGLKLPLVPPMEVEFFGDYLLVVQPFAERPLDRQSALMVAIQQQLLEFHEGLRNNGLVLADTMQGGITYDIPFLYDFSDLQEI